MFFFFTARKCIPFVIEKSAFRSTRKIDFSVTRNIESTLTNIDHSQKVKAIFERDDYHSKDCDYLPESTAEFRFRDLVTRNTTTKDVHLE
jgi:hypothetical protein